MVHLMTAALLILFLLQSGWSDRTPPGEDGVRASLARGFIVHHEAAVRAVAAAPKTSGAVTPHAVPPASPWRFSSCASGGVVASWITDPAGSGIAAGEPIVAGVRRLLGRRLLHNPAAAPPAPAGLADPPGLGVVRNGAFTSTVGATWTLPAGCSIADGQQRTEHARAAEGGQQADAHHGGRDYDRQPYQQLDHSGGSGARQPPATMPRACRRPG